MNYCSLGSLIGLVGLLPALAQNGDRKGHDKMGKIVPEELIPPAPVPVSYTHLTLPTKA